MLGTWKYIHDKNGRLIESRYLNADGELTEYEDGIAIVRYKYNELGNAVEKLVEYCFYGLDDELIEDHNGIAITRQQYDAQGDVVEERYFNKNGEEI